MQHNVNTEEKIQKFKAEINTLKEKLANSKNEITDLKRNLKKSDYLFNQLPAGIILIQEGKIIEINDTLLDQLDYKAEEIIGYKLLDYIESDDREYFEALHHTWSLGKKAPDQYETCLLTKSNQAIPYRIKIKPVRHNNRRAFLLNLTDSKERKAKEKEEIHSRKSEALLTMATGLKQELQDLIDPVEDCIRYLKRISSKYEDLIGVTEDLGERFSHIHSIIHTLEIYSGTKNKTQGVIPVELNNCVKDAVLSTIRIWKEDPENRGVKINFKTYLRSSSQIECNPDEIRDAIIEMIKNAVEAMPFGGELYITTEDNAGYAHIFIQDSGTGIPEKKMEKIFDPFFSTKGSDRSGNGLTRSYALIKQHRGDIDVSSQAGLGTIVHIALPSKEQADRSKPKPNKKNIKESQILVIQEDDVARELLSHLFSLKECRLDTSEKGIEGLGKHKKRKYDLIIADMDSLKTETTGFLKKARSINPDLLIALIVNEPEHINHYNRSLVDISFIKPLEMTRVVRQISELLMTR